MALTPPCCVKTEKGAPLGAAHMFAKIFIRTLTFAAAGVLIGACASLPRLAAVPDTQTTQPRLWGIANARFYLDEPGLKALAQESIAASERERQALGGGPRALPPVFILALSGGGDDGAFGAGLLAGWSAHGDRPQFKAVTGISTGALSAPFAFLGSKYDAELRNMYTQLDAASVFTRRSIVAVLADDAMASSAPLQEMIRRYLSEDVVVAIGQEYGKGRLLLVGTTNLDAGRPVIWNIGAIAASSEPGTREIIAKILLASASIPGALPPVLFDVEIGGQRFQEMHVDGGAVAQAFLYPPGLAAAGKFGKRRRVAYIIRNGRLNVPWKQVDRDTLAIAARATATLIASNGADDLYRIYATTKRDSVDFNLAHIRSDFDVPYKGPFEPAYMASLFDYGFELGRRGYAWDKAPPGFSR